MRASTLWNTLCLLSGEQREGLNAFVLSPYFNPDIKKGKTQVQDLLLELLAHDPNDETEEPEAEMLFRAVFKGEGFSKSKLDKTKSQLLQLVRHFVAVNNICKNTFRIELELVRFYREQLWEERFFAATEKAEETLFDLPERDELFFLNSFHLQLEKCLHEIANNHRKGDLNIPRLLDELDVFYLLTKIKFHVQLAQQRRFVAVEHSEILPLAKILEIVQASTFGNYPVLDIYGQVLRLIVEKDGDFLARFSNVRALIKKEAHLVSDEARKDLHTFLRNFCTYRHNSGDEQFLNMLLELYKEDLRSGVLYVNGYVLAGAMANIVQVGLRLGEFDWVFHFIESHRHKIGGTAHPAEAYNFNMASYYFQIKDFEKAWSLLEWDFEDIFYKLISKRVEVKILYEKEEWDLLDSRLNALKIFIHRASPKTISVLMKEMNNAFVRYVQQLMNPSTAHSSARIEKIRTRIIAEKIVADRDWLLEKLDEMKK